MRTHPLNFLFVLCLLAPPLQADIDVQPPGKDREKEQRREEKQIEGTSERRKREQERPGESTPPVPAEASAEVPEGRDVQIPLRASSTGTVEFLLRSAPRQGRILELRRTGEATALVVYRHVPTPEPSDTDQFLIAARAPDGTVSAPVRVSIRILRTPPRLEWSGEGTFGRVLIGEVARRTLRLQNTGGGVIEGNIETTTPWTASTDRFHLPAHANAEVVLSLRPSEERTYLGEARLAANVPPPPPLALRADAVAPFRTRVEPENLRNPRPVLIVESRNPTPITLTLTGPPGLQLEPGLTLPPEARIELPLRKTSGTVEAVEGTIELRSPLWAESVPVRISPDPAQLVAYPSRLDAGGLEPGRSETHEIRIGNAGGIETEVRVEAGAGLVVQPSRFKLSPGERVAVRVAIQTAAAGPFASTLRFVSDAGALVLPVAGSAEGTAPRAGEVLPRSEASRLEPSIPATTPALAPGLNAPAGLRIERRGRTWIELAWDLLPGVETFVVEGRRLDIDASKRALLQRWMEAPETTVRREPDRMVARIEALTPGRSHTVRVTALDDEGRRGPASRILTASTAPSWRPRIRLLPLLILAGTGLLVLALVQRYRRGSVPT